MCITEYDEAWTMELFKEEGREEGRKEGLIEGREEGREKGREEGREAERVSLLRRLISKMNMSEKAAMDFIGIPEEEYPKYAAILKETADNSYQAKEWTATQKQTIIACFSV